MRPRSLLVLTVAAAIATPVSAGDGHLTSTDASLISALVVVAAPFSLASAAGEVLSQASSTEKLERNKQWRVAAVRPQGDKTALELRSEDKTLKLETIVATTTARAQKLQVEDEIGLETIGKSGYTLKKAGTTIGVLVRPESGLVHSKARA
ncbi:hypothetical protein [Massilia sp. Mn16-1_5]|uniref:hypothetical protein n=1 Tax=Massilia sp. Mn16-1_5 TaxID=2079199 RepID=UPI00109EABEC|nr:hypothetical protein [Massilia sp. Mn16-1_5]